MTPSSSFVTQETVPADKEETTGTVPDAIVACTCAEKQQLPKSKNLSKFLYLNSMLAVIIGVNDFIHFSTRCVFLLSFIHNIMNYNTRNKNDRNIYNIYAIFLGFRKTALDTKSCSQIYKETFSTFM